MSENLSLRLGRMPRMIASAAMIGLMGCAAGTGSVPHRALTAAPSVIGAVLDVDSRKRLTNCHVVVIGTKIATRSDENGRFRLSLPDASVWSIRAQAYGYHDQVRAIRVRPGHFDTLTFRMKWRPPVN